MKFFLGYINNVIMIYSCIWFVWSIGEHEEELTSSILITGLRFGSFFLALFALNDYLVKRIWSECTINELELIVMITILFNLVFNVLTIVYGHIVFLGLVVLLASVFKSVHTLYFDKMNPQLSAQYEDYDSSLEFVDEIQGIVTLSAMPFFWAIIMNDDDMYRPLVGSIIGFVVMLGVWGWKSRIPKKRKME